MSGAAGGTRIPRAAVEQTVKDFVNNILSKIPGFKSAKISGSYNQPVKQDFGDIDLVVSIETDQPKKEVKKMIVDYFEGLSDKELPYLNTEKHKGKKAINHGEIISNLYPISGMPGEFVQVDNIIAVSESEGDFKKVVLDYPAEIQGLILGLVKTPLLEEDPEQVFKRMGIKDVPSLGPNQEYEFHLDTSGLALKIVTLDENYRQLDSNVVWESTSWEDVKRLLKDFNLDGTFEQFVEKIKKFKNPRSKNRVKGFFKTSIKVGPAEKGTPKGDGKQQALDTVAALEEKYGSFAINLIKPLLLEQEAETIAIFPGKFKPPHKDHLARIQAAAKMADQVRVIIGPNPVAKNDEAAISAQESLAIFDLYKKKNLVPDNVTFEISDIPSPVLKAYQEFEANPEQKYVAIFGKDDAARFKGLAKMPNVTINNFPEANIGDSSATDLRKAIAARDIAAIKQFLPFGVSPSEYLDTLNMPEKEPLQETYKGKRTNDGAPGTLKAKISKLYGGDVTIEKARKLKNRENATPHDKRQANWFINFHSKNESSDPQSGKAAPYGSGYKPLEEELAPYIQDLTKHMYNQGLTIDPAPEIEFIEDQDNAKNPLGKTAYYDPNNRVIALYVTGRHPKDILRSFAHEMIHHCQNLEGRLGNIHTTNVNEDDYLKSLEREAYERGNMSFRSWENSLRGDNGVRYIKGFSPSDHNDELIMAEGKYDSLSNKLSGMIFKKWKEDYEAGKSIGHFEWYVIDEKTGLEFDLYADAQFVDEDIYSVEGGANAGNEEEDPFIRAEFKIDIQQLPGLWEKIAFDLKDFMRHEIEHLTQQGPNLIEPKRRNSDQARREKIRVGELPSAKYPVLRSEIEPMLQGMYFSAKKQRRPFIDVINDWFNSRGFNDQEKKEILRIWKPYLKQLSLPKF
jgi:nicotinamide mononucleotide adenylyltransferase